MKNTLFFSGLAKRVVAFLAFATLAAYSFAQTPTTFRFSYDLGAFDITGGMVQTPARDFAIAGLNNSFGPYYGDVLKIDTAGNITWAKAYTSGFATNFTDIKNVSTGGYIITGSSTSGGGGALLLRIDGSGNVLWAYRYQLPNINSSKPSNEYGNAVMETSDGGFLVGGGVDYFWDGSSAATVDTTMPMGFKVNSSGTLLWSKVWTIATINPDEHYINDVAESADGYFFVGQSSEGTGTLNSNGDYPSNALIVKTSTAGALTYIRRWGVGNTTSQGINAALKLSTGNILLGGEDDVNAFIVSISGTGSTTPSVVFNKRLNGSAFGNTYLLQDVMENSDGNYSMIGTQLAFLSVSLNTMIGKINSTSGAWMFGRTYAPIGLSAILPEGGLCTDQGYYISMTDQQPTGFNFNVIRTDVNGQTNDPASGCAGTAITPALGSESITFTTPTSSNYDLMTASSFTPSINNMSPTKIQHCFNTASVLNSSVASTDATCNGSCNGTATVTPSGGTSPYTYTWSPSGGNAATASGLCPNTYTCTIKDGAGTIVTKTVTISQPAALSATQSQGSINCSGGTTTASVSPSGGTGPYTYTWSPSGGNNQSANLGAGTYTATTHDANGCATTNTFSISNPPAITLTVNSSPAGCGVSNGSATVTAGGGTGSFSYTWSPSGGNSSTASGLAAGQYTINAADANNCTSSSTFSIGTTNGPTATAAQTSGVSCNGLSNGTASLTISGGLPGYTVTCPSGSVSGNTINNLPAGTYTATVTDQNSCTTTATVTISEPSPVAITFTNNSPSACGANTGSVTANATGGTGTMTYSWSSGATGATLTNAAAGSYTAYATDANGCKDSSAVTITSAGGPTASAAETASVTCSGFSNGTASVSISGGTPTYSVTWSSGTGSGTTVSGLSAGTVTATITDINGCLATATVTINEPTPIVITFTNNSPSACTSPTGSVTANASGGTGVLTYSWNTSATGPNLNNVSAGIYTVTVTDANSCSQVSQVTINSVNGPTITAVGSTQPGCNGGANGTATVNVAGGTPSYTVTWSGGAGSGTSVSGLSAGIYTITAVDAAGCTSIDTISVSQPPAITMTLTSSPTGCVGSTGSATVSAGGGTGAMTYTWSNSQAGATATGLAAGVYTATATDANNCVATGTVSVGVTNPPVISVDSILNVRCNGQSNGMAWASATGGTPTYTFTWSNSQTGSSSTGWAQGNYSVVVTDAGGCKDTANFSISQPTTLSVTVNSVKPDHCNKSDGSATATGSGGTPNYSYHWNNGTNTQTTGNLAAGTYTVLVTDANGCKDSTTQVISPVAGPTITLSGHTDVTCNGLLNGSATVSANGGTPVLTYSWTSGATGTNTVSGLGAGSYTATVTDSAGCISSVQVNIQQPGVLLISSTVTPVSCSGGSNGSATVSSTGGTFPYHYNWSGGQTGTSVSGLAFGAYTVTVTDTNQCQSNTVVIVTEPLPVDTANFSGSMCVTDQTIVLSAPVGSLPSYQWYQGNSPILGATSYTFTGNPANVTNYSVTWFYNGCRYTSTSNYVVISQDMGTLPQTNVFSPNGDNINDTYLPFYIGNLGTATVTNQLLQSNIDDYDFTIYDRWGVLLFHTTSILDAWDGTNNGKPVLEGTYYWIARYNPKCSKLTGEQTIKGFVQLLR